jgi:hypothetical protein
MGEVRFKTLTQSFPAEAERLNARLEKESRQRFTLYRKLAEGQGIL